MLKFAQEVPTKVNTINLRLFEAHVKQAASRLQQARHNLLITLEETKSGNEAIINRLKS